MYPLNIYHNAESAPEFLPLNSLVNDKYELASAKIPTGTVDAVIIDPPYTDGKTDALPNHKIQTKISISHIMQEAHRILKPEGFFVFFGQMPTVVEWLVEAQKVFKYREHITWCKRNITSPYLPIQRSKEDIFIYAKGKPQYWETQEKYEDLKMSGINLGLYDYQTMLTTISDLQRRLKDNAYNMLYFQGINVDNSPVPAPENVPNEEDFADEVMLNFDDLIKKTHENPPLSDRRNDALMQNAFQKTLENRAAAFEDLERGQKLEVAHGKANDKWLENKLPNAARERAKFEENREKGKQVRYQDPASNDKTFNKGRDIKSAHRYRSKHWCNITNTWYFLPQPEDRAVAEICTVWSYLGQNQTTFGAQGENWKHPTVKPAKLLKRLIKLLTPEPEKAGYTPVIVDFFNGSGTTTKAAAELGRAFYGFEVQPDYFGMCVARTEAAMSGEKVLSKDVVHNAAPVQKQQQSLF